MFVVTGVTGRVGSATANQLLDDGAAVRVLVRRSEDAAPWVARGADARVADLRDRAALGDAITGCTGLFVLLPFDLTAGDLDAHADEIVASVAGAVADRQVPHVVMLSSGGADLAEGTGPIAGLYRLEQALQATGAVVTALRPGHFQEKVGDVLDVARASGVYPVFATSAEVPLALVATRDIGVVAARALQSPPSSSESVDVLGPTYSEREVAELLGDALGRRLEVAPVPEPAWAGALTDAGLPPHVAESLAELHRADEHGLLAPRGDRRVQTSTRIETTIAGMLAA